MPIKCINTVLHWISSHLHFYCRLYNIAKVILSVLYKMSPIGGFNKETRIWNGANTMETFNKNISVGQVLLKSLERYPDKVVQVKIYV